jgi:hypothetical protein
MFAGPDRLETNKGNLHTRKRTNCIPRRVSHIKSAGEPTHEDQDQGVKRDHVRDERVST